MGQRRHNIFCAVLNCGEIFLLSPPLPPFVTPNFTPSLELFWVVLHFLRHFSPLWKKVGAHMCWGLGGCLFGGLEGEGVWRKVGRGICILSIKIF